MKSNLIRIVMAMTMTILYINPLYSQTASYKVLNSEISTSANVRLTLVVYGKSKKTIDAEAQCAALRAVLFNGCPNTPFSKAFIDDGERTSAEKYPQYFENLYNVRYTDFIASCEAISAFKKGDKNKGTEYSIVVKALNLRKDLEKNGIKQKLGL